jgi:hypothetical protein
VEVVVQHQRHQGPRGRAVEGVLHLGDVADAHLAVPVEEGPVVGGGGVEPDEVQPGRRLDLDAAGHEPGAGPLPQAVVVSRHHREALAERREDAPEGAQLVEPAAVGHVPAHEHAVDPGGAERRAEPLRGGVVPGTLADVKVGEMSDGPHPDTPCAPLRSARGE